MFSLAIAVFAMMIACFGIIAEMRQIQITKRIQSYIMEEWEERKEKPLLSEELDNYLLTEAEGEDVGTRAEAIGALIGKGIARSMRYATMQDKSVASKVQNRWDSNVKDAIQDKMPPQFKILRKVAEELGFDFDDILAANEIVPFVKSLKKHGAGGLLTKESSPSW